MAIKKRYRLKKRAEFAKVYESGRSAAQRSLVLYVLPCVGANRIGFSAGKKLGGAVVRNRLKRRLREIVRLHFAHLAPGYCYIVIARGNARNAHLTDIEREFVVAARRLKVWLEP